MREPEYFKIGTPEMGENYHEISNIRHTKCQNINDFNLVLELPFTLSIKPNS